MTKKEYLLKLLTVLNGKRGMAAGLKLLIENNVFDDQTIDGLQHIFADAIKQISSKKAQASLIKSQQFLKKLKELEINQKESDESLDVLLKNI